MNDDGSQNAKSYHQDPRINVGRILASPSPGEEVVITGIAGRFPECDNVYELRDKLFNKVDMLSDDDRRWSFNHPELPKRTGKLPNIDKFDAGYFGIHYKQAASMNPLLRMTLETVIEAIMDAGWHPAELEGTKTGVYVATAMSQTEDIWFRQSLNHQNLAVTGTAISMLPNRISYFLKLQGPSYAVDTACSSSLHALDEAYRSIRNKEVNTALVVGASICLNPFIGLQFSRLGNLSERSICAPFDIDADGFVRSETIGVLILQKSKTARRIYSQILHCNCMNDGFKSEGILHTSEEAQIELLKEFVEESRIDPEDVVYLEAHGTGTPVGDTDEVNSKDAVFCKNRKTPLLIGSIKSNMGHAEYASGVAAIVKIVISMEEGAIPPNIHFTRPRPTLEALVEDRLRVVAEKTSLPGTTGLLGVSNFGFGGSIAQTMLKWNTKTKSNRGLMEDNLPRLVCVSGRTRQAVDTILGALDKYKSDPEYIRLYHQVFARNFDNHHYRGYTILTKAKQVLRCVHEHRGEKQPLYLAFSDFSGNWTKIYEDLEHFPIFAQSLQHVNDVLLTKGLTLTNLMQNSKTQRTKSSFNQIIGNLAVQLAFADMLKVLNIQPEGTLGVGFGEFACGYFEDCLTLEETITSVYRIAQSIWSTAADTGAHFAELETDEAKIVGCLSQILVKPKLRPARWLSTIENKLASVEFFLGSISNAFTLPNVFLNVGKHSTIFEIGNGQLDASTNKFPKINFEKIAAVNATILLLENFGSLYNSGCNLDLAKIYPKVEYPVSRSTPMISPFIKWDHTAKWHVGKYESKGSFSDGKQHVHIDLNSKHYSYIAGHVVDGRNLFPATGYLQLVWDALAEKWGNDLNNSRIVFKHCRFLRAANIPKDQKLEMVVQLKSVDGYFEIWEKDTLLVSGQVFIDYANADHQIDLPQGTPTDGPDTCLKLTAKDIYKELRIRGYNYSGDFCNLVECTIDALCGKVRWIDNWVTFLDNMLQMSILQSSQRGLQLPVEIKRLSIDAAKHLSLVQMDDQHPEIPVYANKHSGTIKSIGIEMRGIKYKQVARKSALEEPVLQKYQFVPLEAYLELWQAVTVDVQIVLENTPSIKMKVVELIDEMTSPDSEPLSLIILQTLADLPYVQGDVSVFTKEQMNLKNIRIEDKSLKLENDCHLIVASNVLKRPKVFRQVISALRTDGYLLSRESMDFHPSQFHNAEMIILTIYASNVERLVLCKRIQPNPTVPVALNVDDTVSFSWLPKLQELVKDNEDVLIYSQNQPQNGVLGLVNCIHRELCNGNVHAMLINDKSAPAFDINDQFYRKQLKKQLAISVYKNREWGTYRFLKVDALQEIECEHGVANTLTKGDLSSIRWIEGPLKSNTTASSDDELIHVYYASVNFRDVMIALGRIHPEGLSQYRKEFSQGLEFVGRTSDGQRVMGFGEQGALSNVFVANKHMLWPIPDHWTMEDAATVPMVYGTVIFGLFMRTTLMPGNSILIHSGAGAIGQAAINLCLHYGCQIFTTVGTEEKRTFLKERFPKLTDAVIGNSRDTSFEQMIYRETNGRGVDFVLNSLAEEKLLASVRCLAHGGQFLEIGRFDCENDHLLQLLLMEKEATINGVMLDHFVLSSPSYKMELARLIHQGIANDSIQPLTRTVFEKEEIVKAFKYMTTGKHMGKVIIKIRGEEAKIVRPAPSTMKAIPRYRCDPEKTSIIVGGLGGFGLELADWLVLRGARRLILASRTGVKTGYQASRVQIWRSYGVQIFISTADITTKSGCEQLIAEATQLGPVQSIFNLAVVLQDGILENHNENTFKTSFAPKAYATRYLDEITRNKCPELREFVTFSSVVCGRGNTGQTNYGMANSVMERICEKRKEDGYPALAIEWGAVGDVGIVAETQETGRTVLTGGTLEQPIPNCLEVLDLFLKQDNAIVSSIVVSKKEHPFDMNLVETVAKILGFKDLKIISLHSTFPELGMDSLTAVEIKQTLEREFQIILSPKEIRSLTFTQLYKIQEDLSGGNQITPIEVSESQTSGLEMMISHIDDGVDVKLQLVELDTKSDQQLQNHSRILFFPGYEGIAKILLPLSKNLHCQAFSVQYSFDNPKDTIEEMAAELMPSILETVKNSETFHFVAYSFGIAVALEVVKVLESEGYYGQLLCLDGGPEFHFGLVNLHFDPDNNENRSQTNLLCYIMSMYMPQKIIIENQECLAKCESLEERLDIIEKITPKEGKYRPKHLRKIGLAVYKRARAIKNYYRSEFKLKATDIQLFKPSMLLINGLSDDYGLSKCCKQRVAVRVFTGNHLTMLENLEMAKSIDFWVRKQ